MALTVVELEWGWIGANKTVLRDGSFIGASTLTWYSPADGVPLSGQQAEAACRTRGERLCKYHQAPRPTPFGEH